MRDDNLYELKESEPVPMVNGVPVNVVDCRDPPLIERVPEPTINKDDCGRDDWIVT